MSQKNNKICQYDAEKQKIIDTHYKGALVSGYVNCNGYMLTDMFPKVEPIISQFDIRNDDIWVIAYPKSGSYINFYA